MQNKIIAYSDNVWPFCYIGAERLKNIQKDIPFEIECRAFELHTEVPVTGMKLEEYFGGQAEAFVKQVTDYGQDVGLTINTKQMSNSRTSLKLNEYAKSQDKFEAFHTEIFKAYFEKGENIGDTDILLNIAERAGLDPSSCRQYLNSDEADYIITQSQKEANHLGINAVPSFIINNEIIRGALPTDQMRQIISQAFIN